VKSRLDRQWELYDRKFLDEATYELRAVAKASFYVGHSTNKMLVEVDKENGRLRGEFAIVTMEAQELESEVTELKRKLENADLMYTTSDRGRAAFRASYEMAQAKCKKVEGELAKLKGNYRQAVRGRADFRKAYQEGRTEIKRLQQLELEKVDGPA
jgi:chromosome segregation ATPase